MRIAYLVNQYPTISHTFIRREIQALEALGHCVERYSIRDTRNKFVDPLDAAEWEKTFVLLQAPRCAAAALRVALTQPRGFLMAVGKSYSLWRNGGGLYRHVAYLTEACRLYLALRRNNIEHVHAHFGTNSTAVAFLCRALGGPSYSFTVHGPEEFDRPASESLETKIAGAIFVVAVSNFGRSQLQRWCPVEQWHKINVVRCGVSDDFLSHTPSLVQNTTRLLCVARLSEQKGLLTLLDAAEQLARNGTEFELILIGDGPLRAELESRVARANLADRVQLVGAQTGDKVREWLAASRALVLPSYAEGLPVVIMEAFALARPVISTYVAGIPELVVSGDNGWLVPAGSVEDLAAAVRTALGASLSELNRMGMLGRERVRELHTSSNQAQRLAELFEARGLGLSERVPADQSARGTGTIGVPG